MATLDIAPASCSGEFRGLRKDARSQRRQRHGTVASAITA